MHRPAQNEYPQYYHNYIELAKGDSVKEIIEKYSKEINNKIIDLPTSKADYAYALGKWTVKELLQHLIDTERIFVYRALRFSRKDSQPLLGFEEDDYVANSNASTRNLDSLKEEFIALRKANDIFFETLTAEQLAAKGFANNNEISVNAIIFICFGHLLHHINILHERYL